MAAIQTKPASPETLAQKFDRLADTWQKAVAHHSSTSKRENHPAYKEIIALGPAVIPLLLRDLEKTHRHWFAALAELTGADPIPSEIAGNIPAMIEAWLKWSKEQGLQW